MGESTRGKETGQKSTFSEEEKGNGNKVAGKEKVDMSPVEIASHLSIWSALYHMLWSGEIQHFRQGVLTDKRSHRFVRCLPIYTNVASVVHGNSFCLRAAYIRGRIRGAHTGSIVFVQFVRTTLLQMSSTDDGEGFHALVES